jgi:hypothetical protein
MQSRLAAPRAALAPQVWIASPAARKDADGRHSITAALRMHTMVAWAGLSETLRTICGRSQR